MNKEKKDANITFRCTKKLKNDIEELATKAQRKVSDYVNMQLMQHVQDYHESEENIEEE